MDANEKMLYSKLRETRNELIERLQCEKSSPIIRPLIEEELKDIDQTLVKIEKGNFGICEISGELLPPETLMEIPTIKSINDVNSIKKFYSKSIYS